MPNININIVVQPMLLPILKKKNLWWAGNARAQNKPHFRMSKIRFQYRGYDIRSVNYASTTSASTKKFSRSYANFSQNPFYHSFDQSEGIECAITDSVKIWHISSTNCFITYLIPSHTVVDPLRLVFKLML